MRFFITLLLLMGSFATLLHAAEDGTGGAYDLGIESMRSHGYSVGIFAFMMIAIAVFVGIMIGFYRMDAKSEVKKGERVLFVMIGFGVLAAGAFAAIQLLDGFLF